LELLAEGTAGVGSKHLTRPKKKFSKKGEGVLQGERRGRRDATTKVRHENGRTIGANRTGIKKNKNIPGKERGPHRRRPQRVQPSRKKSTIIRGGKGTKTGRRGGKVEGGTKNAADPRPKPYGEP